MHNKETLVTYELLYYDFDKSGKNSIVYMTFYFKGGHKREYNTDLFLMIGSELRRRYTIFFLEIFGKIFCIGIANFKSNF